ncbi:hypothetical protein BDZ45DRAFT_665151 [Acephala macrosclerotiorum]|nr:hypothetical protein BDZ45DRAFT_665151 [Acephala macrosclerotiorum]
MPHDIKALLAHIKILEEKVKYFEQHHQCCSLVTPVSPPVDEASDDPNGNDGLASPGLEIVPYDPQHAKISKPPNSNPKWRKAADQLLEKVQFTTQWTAWIKQLKSSEIDENASVIAEICGVPAQVPAQIYDRQITNPKADGVIASAQAYARATKASQGNTAFVLKLHAFRELVFVSLCAVLEALGYPISTINETMRICVSDSKDTNLKRLRKGAVWANHRIVELDTALEGNATEWFFDHGVSISQYSLLAANNSNSTAHVAARFLKMKKCPLIPDCSQEVEEVQEAEEGSNWTPLFIPTFIKVLVGDGLKPTEICSILGYSTEYDTERTTKLCHQYVNLRDLAREEISASSTSKRKRNFDVPSTKRRMTTTPGDYQDADGIISNARFTDSLLARHPREHARSVDHQESQEIESRLHSENRNQDEDNAIGFPHRHDLVRSDFSHQTEEADRGGRQSTEITDRIAAQPTLTGSQDCLTEEFSPPRVGDTGTSLSNGICS